MFRLYDSSTGFHPFDTLDTQPSTSQPSKMENIDTSHLPHQTLKDIGNRLFASGQFQEAVRYYTYAITKQPNISSYYSNRALSYVQMQEYAKALPDCRRSIELDESNLKAYFFAGQAYLGLGQWEEALTKLVHAHSLALEQHRNFGDEITSVIRLAKRKRFEAAEEKRMQEEIALQVYLNNLILQDTERQRQAILSANSRGSVQSAPPNSSSLSVPDYRKNGLLNSDNLSTSPQSVPEVVPAHCPSELSSCPDAMTASSSVQVHAVEKEPVPTGNSPLSAEVQQQLSELSAKAQKRIAELNDLFAQVDARRQAREVPEYLCGRISFELMLDPVITPSGITYDRRSILAHLRKVGHFDPLTRQPLTENQLIPNLSMKEVVHAFLEQNPWAENY
ncbi:unnamed protein product [Calicophoron daubneyi]|uniref:E3 ubiquitin-protein ligase CHIP n=1 Tax=Calicophoron daubneyi TaxID=300641 RepID=A0AAV2TG23_CALDB